LALTVSLCLCTLWSVVAQDSSQATDRWHDVTGLGDQALVAASIHQIGRHVYILGSDEGTGGNRSVWVLESGKALPVLAPDGEQLALVELCEMAATAVGSSRSDDKYLLWRIDGAAATAVKG